MVGGYSGLPIGNQPRKTLIHVILVVTVKESRAGIVTSEQRRERRRAGVRTLSPARP